MFSFFSLRAVNVREIEKYYKLVKNQCPRGMEWDVDLEICQELPNYKVEKRVVIYL